MRNNIASYGILLLIAMVITRAVTLDRVNTDELISRANLPYTSFIENQIFRSTFSLTHQPEKRIAEIPFNFNFEVYAAKYAIRKEKQRKSLAERMEQEATNAFQENLVVKMLPVKMEEEIEDLSLDSENTITSSISVLFPRNRIISREEIK